MKYDLNILEEYVEKGLLRKAEDEDLVQYNYSDYCNNEGLWDEITIFNRGNIYEKSTGKLIAKAMPKFLNLGQLPEDKQNEMLSKKDFIVTEKMDGCLGIIYSYKGQIRCNSRGSFDNYVTDKIKELIPKYNLDILKEGMTLNVEVISPETKIICDYGNEENLYLITAYNSEHVEICYPNLLNLGEIYNMFVVKQSYMNWEQLLKWQKEADWQHEGFVVRFPNNERVKIKSDDYLRIAAFTKNLSKYTLWKLWRNDLKQRSQIDHVKEYLDSLPDEIAKEGKQYWGELLQDMLEQKMEVYKLYDQLKDKSKKEIGLYFKDNPNKYQGAIFAIVCGHGLEGSLIEFIKPEEKIDG